MILTKKKKYIGLLMVVMIFLVDSFLFVSASECEFSDCSTNMTLVVISNVVDLNETTSVTRNSTVVLIPQNNNASNITTSLGVENVSLNVSSMVTTSGNISNATLNGTINIISNLSSGLITMLVPEEITISGNSSWEGIINLPTPKQTTSVTVTPDSGYSATVSKVIEIGPEDIELTFDKAIRILFEGETGKLIGYSREGTFTKILSTCLADNQSVGDALSDGGNCKINVGDDLVIWTKHFTKFAIYTQTIILTSTEPSGSPGGGGGESCIYDSNFDWECNIWSECENGSQTRKCKEFNNCDNPYGQPDIDRSCEILEVPVNVKNVLFDIKLEILDSKGLELKINLLNFGVPGRVNASLYYEVSDSAGKVVYEENEIVSVETQIEFIKSIKGLDLNNGKYKVFVDLKYEGQQVPAFAEDFFIIKKSIKENSTVMAILISGGVILFLLFIWIVIKIYKKPEMPQILPPNP
ncbi:hypothetical protein GOV14_02960 [Candidatus Pacearchaeota archaeon]|nr:hypothetical protein [Candidatus Pacearchaeota archaeon]